VNVSDTTYSFRRLAPLLEFTMISAQINVSPSITTMDNKSLWTEGRHPARAVGSRMTPTLQDSVRITLRHILFGRPQGSWVAHHTHWHCFGWSELWRCHEQKMDRCSLIVRVLCGSDPKWKSCHAIVFFLSWSRAARWGTFCASLLSWHGWFKIIWHEETSKGVKSNSKMTQSQFRANGQHQGQWGCSPSPAQQAHQGWKDIGWKHKLAALASS